MISSMQMKFASLILRLISLLSHIVPFVIIYFSIVPIARWYLSKVPILGVDFYNSVTYASYLSRHLGLHFNNFVDNWFGGYPLYRVFVSWHWYTMIPFVAKYDLVKGVQNYVLFALFALIVTCYLLYFHLTKSRALAALLAFLVLFSVNIYGAAVWGGSLPYFATQLFLPLVLLTLDKYVLTRNTRWYLLAILTTGIAFLAHPGPAFAFYVPSAAILLLFGIQRDNQKFFKHILSRLKDVFVFAILSLLVALPVSYERIIHTFNIFIHQGPAAFLAFIKPVSGNIPISPNQVGDLTQPGGLADINKFYQGLAKLLYIDTNIWLFWLLGIGLILFLVTFVLTQKMNIFLRILPYLLIVGYSGAHTWLNANGIIFIPQGWYRAFWTFPVLVGALAAICWGVFFEFIRQKLRLEPKIFGFFITNIPFILLTAVFFSVWYLYFTTKTSSLLETLDIKSEISSAHPQALSIKTSGKDLEILKKELLPGFIDPNEKNKRLYEADALVNIWWTTFYELPLARGYIDPPLGISQRGGLFWLDIALGNDSLVRDFKVPEATAFNNALFLIDWYGIYYYEGGRFGIDASVPPSSYLLKNNLFEKEVTTETHGALIKWQTPSGKPELNLSIPQYLRFFKVKNENTSPILYPSGAPSILVFTDDSGYENVMRGFAAENFNSRYVVPVNAGKYIDDIASLEFSKFDAVILHNYSYHSQKKAFNLLSKFLDKGGKVYIDTGAESKESNAKKLPELLPFESSERKGLGKQWKIETNEDEILENVNVGNFGPLVFNEDEWKISYPLDDLKDSSKIIISHAGKPVLIRRKVGGGEVIWSGFNLLYHLNQYNSQDEAKLFANIIRQLVAINKTEPIPSEVKWFSSQNVRISSKNGARGVIFKEEFYPGWKAKVKSGNQKNISMYRVGPTHPGFMYVAFPKNNSKPFVLDFKYSGELSAYFYYGLSLLFSLVLLDLVLFNGKVFVNRFRYVRKATNQKVSVWWEKEDE